MTNKYYNAGNVIKDVVGSAIKKVAPSLGLKKTKEYKFGLMKKKLKKTKDDMIKFAKEKSIDIK